MATDVIAAKQHHFPPQIAAMTDKKRWWNDWPVWVAVALVLIGVYGGACLACVEAEGTITSTTMYPVYSNHARLNSALRRCFVVAHHIDRAIRPNYWALS